MNPVELAIERDGYLQLNKGRLGRIEIFLMFFRYSLDSQGAKG
jgi:hypothetical protein